MTSKEFSIKIKQFPEKLQRFIDKDGPRVMGKTARDFFSEGFRNEGFTDKSLVKWKEVKRREDPRITGARASRPILTGDTGDLGESIRYKVKPGEVVIHSDLPYADAHNSGTTTAGRGRNVTIPKRQFIGPSEQLDKRITDELDKMLDNLFK